MKANIVQLAAGDVNEHFTKCLGAVKICSVVVVCQLRHSGPSHDRAHLIRDLPEIKLPKIRQVWHPFNHLSIISAIITFVEKIGDLVNLIHPLELTPKT